MNRALTLIILALVAMWSAATAGHLLAQRLVANGARIPEAQGLACSPAPAQPSHSAADGPTPYSDARPPARFQGSITMRMQFVAPSEVTTRCVAIGDDPPPCGYTWLACTMIERRESIFPNPCASPGDPYADLLCHELAHANGWPATHGP